MGIQKLLFPDSHTAGEFSHLKPNGTPRYAALQKRREGLSTKIAQRKQIGTDKELDTARNIRKALFDAKQALIQAESVAKNQEPTQEVSAVRVRRKSQHHYDTEEGEAARINGGIHL